MRPQLSGSRFRSCVVLAAGALAAVTLVGSAQTTQTSQTTPTTPLGQPLLLHLVSTPWPPFTNAVGRPRFALDLVEAGLDRIAIKAVTDIVEPVQFTQALLSDKYDGSGAAWKDAQRERSLIYSEPYLENRLILVGRRGASVSASALGALKGKRVAIVGGYAYGDIENTGPTFVRTQGEEDSLSQLLEGKVDYILMDELVVEYIVSNYATEAQTKLALGSTPLVTRQLYLALRRTLPDADSIIKRFNKQLTAMIVDRTYHKLLHVPWIMADINGDGIPEYVPASDTAGPAPPKSAYSLFAEPPQEKPTVVETNRPGFYVGGMIYPDWASVPDQYKTPPSPVMPQNFDAARNTGSLFTFNWK